MLGQHPQMYGFPELNLFMAETLDEFWRGVDSDGGRKFNLLAGDAPWSIANRSAALRGRTDH